MFKKVAFTYYPVTDVARARKFYEETLGLKSGSAGNQGDNWWVEYDLPGGGCLALTNFTKEKPSDSAGGTIAFEVDFDVLGEFFRGACDRLEAKHSKPLPDVGQRHDLDDLAMKESYDLFWRPGRYDETLPVVARDIRIAELRRGRQIRQRLRARLARHREAAQSALYHLLCSRRRRGEAYLRMSPDR
jgi:hypothetical protein